jgi:hypothetical protein
MASAHALRTGPRPASPPAPDGAARGGCAGGVERGGCAGGPGRGGCAGAGIDQAPKCSAMARSIRLAEPASSSGLRRRR